MVKKSRTKKRSASKGRKAPKKTARTASKKPARKVKAVRKSRPRAAVARKAKPAARKTARPTPARKAAAPKKSVPLRKPPARKDFVARSVPVTAVAAGAAASPSGEVYGVDGWKEEELSASELDTDAVELDELEGELEGPEITSETDEDPEW